MPNKKAPPRKPVTAASHDEAESISDKIEHAVASIGQTNAPKDHVPVAPVAEAAPSQSGVASPIAKRLAELEAQLRGVAAQAGAAGSNEARERDDRVKQLEREIASIKGD